MYGSLIPVGLPSISLSSYPSKSKSVCISKSVKTFSCVVFLIPSSSRSLALRSEVVVALSVGVPKSMSL